MLLFVNEDLIPAKASTGKANLTANHLSLSLAAMLLEAANIPMGKGKNPNS
jgi:hypothetical protein